MTDDISQIPFWSNRFSIPGYARKIDRPGNYLLALYGCGERTGALPGPRLFHLILPHAWCESTLISPSVSILHVSRNQCKTYLPMCRSWRLATTTLGARWVSATPTNTTLVPHPLPHDATPSPITTNSIIPDTEVLIVCCCHGRRGSAFTNEHP